VLLGGGFQPTVNVLRILSLLPPLIAVTQSLGYQWLLPHGREKVVNRIIIGAGLLNVTLAVFLAPRFAHIGMALAVVCAEIYVATRMLYTVMNDRSCQLFSFATQCSTADDALNDVYTPPAIDSQNPAEVSVLSGNSISLHERRQDQPDFGALVISLDLELHWGIRDQGSAEENEALAANREAVLRLLKMFDEFDIAATWAAVGFLFAEARSECHAYAPALKPTYTDRRLYPYREEIGRDEADDPFHYAPSLLAAIAAQRNQEVATHTFSHYYCLEPGQTKEQFDADIASAIAIANNSNFDITSIVFPRNQCNPDYFEVLQKRGITCYRGNESAWMYRALPRQARQSIVARAARLLDSYVNIAGHNITGWDQIAGSEGLSNVPSSRYLRPHSKPLAWLDPLRLKRITDGIQRAAVEKKVFHLWWHPHDFGLNTEENFAFLRKILEAFADCRSRRLMRSLTMAEASRTACQYRARLTEPYSYWNAAAPDAVGVRAESAR
jgi:peptidoglycan/xylan/chitin deacetylase (PgdA/CDA1 family)